jgi:hypothetical protein
LDGARKRARKAKQELPPDWQTSAADLAFAASKGLTEEETREEADRFANHHRAKGSLMADWDAAWRNWILNSIKFKGHRNAQANRFQKPNPRAVGQALADAIRERERAAGLAGPRPATVGFRSASKEDDPVGGS